MLNIVNILVFVTVHESISNKFDRDSSVNLLFNLNTSIVSTRLYISIHIIMCSRIIAKASSLNLMPVLSPFSFLLGTWAGMVRNIYWQING